MNNCTPLPMPQKVPARRRFLNSSFISLIGAVLLSSTAFAKDLTITEADNGKNVSLQVGDTVTLQLEGNPTTGYLWEISSKDQLCLKKVDQSFTSSSTLIGSGGVFSFIFRATSKGSSTLHLTYSRPWEKETPPAKTFEVTVAIDSAE